jgi:hypothetical protein
MKGRLQPALNEAAGNALTKAEQLAAEAASADVAALH